MKANRFAVFAWGVLAYNLAVVLFGAFVRATGSGAGCGSHWPLCNGAIIPRAPQIETIIEYSHRLTSGLAMLLVLALGIWAWRRFPSGHPVRRGAGLSMFFIVTEALVGAGLVLFEMVAHNTSEARIYWMAAHLINTFLLLASLALTGWWAMGGSEIKLSNRGIVLWGFAIGLLGVLLIGVTGAITALGDTLFPAATLQEGLAQDFSQEAHFLVQLRIYHPIIAIVVGFYLVFLAGLVGMLHSSPLIKRFAWWQIGLFFAQLLAGLLNVILLAPVRMQLVHLLLADLVWITLVLFTAATLGEVAEPEAAAQPVHLPDVQ